MVLLAVEPRFIQPAVLFDRLVVPGSGGLFSEVFAWSPEPEHCFLGSEAI
jgi:hypothetical protein